MWTGQGVKTTIDGPNQGKVATRDGERRFSPAIPHQTKCNLTQTLNLPNCIPKNIFKTFELFILWIFGKKFRGFLSRLKRIWQGIVDGYLVGNLASCNAMTLWFGPNELGHASHIYFSIILAGESHLFSKRLEGLLEDTAKPVFSLSFLVQSKRVD